jgi:hypothetical protein
MTLVGCCSAARAGQASRPGFPTPSPHASHAPCKALDRHPAPQGLTEEQAVAQLGDVDVYSASFRPMRNTISGSPHRTFMKLLVDAATGKVVGCHMVGDEAAEIMQVGARGQAFLVGLPFGGCRPSCVRSCARGLPALPKLHLQPARLARPQRCRAPILTRHLRLRAGLRRGHQGRRDQGAGRQHGGWPGCTRCAPGSLRAIWTRSWLPLRGPGAAIGCWLRRCRQLTRPAAACMRRSASTPRLRRSWSRCAARRARSAARRPPRRRREEAGVRLGAGRVLGRCKSQWCGGCGGGQEWLLPLGPQQALPCNTANRSCR